MTTSAYASVTERSAEGRSAREHTSRSSHAGWHPAQKRHDPIALLEEQNATREPELVPVRHGRMMVSPFTFYRGAAKIMAADLATTPTAGLTVQCCGDAHLSNFGVFASPERTLLFDLNDFDETLPGPFEWDVKRMAASFSIAARNNGFAEHDVRTVTRDNVRSYRSAMREFAEMRTLDIWYARLSEDALLRAVKQAARAVARAGNREVAAAGQRRALKTSAKAHASDSLHALAKLAVVVDGHYRIVSQPPVVVPLNELAPKAGMSVDELRREVGEQLYAYRETLQPDRRALLERFEIVDMALKVVGVGSVGTRAFIVLLQGRDSEDPLFLQVKEASRSVLEDHLPTSEYKNPGERVVQGQRMMQAASDLFLGWTKGTQANRFLYWRQLRDMKGSAAVEAMAPEALGFYASMCGWTLARAHARSGDPVAIAAYLGKSDTFDRAIEDFGLRYARQNDEDYGALIDAIKSGRLTALEGV